MFTLKINELQHRLHDAERDLSSWKIVRRRSMTSSRDVKRGFLIMKVPATRRAAPAFQWPAKRSQRA
jgi:hypothetical protein